MKKVVLISGFIISSVFLFSQDSIPKDSLKLWKKGGVASLNFSQSVFRNWSAGGQDAISGTAFLSLYANYKKKKSAWDNTLDLAYGLSQQGKKTLIKSDDKIDFSSKYGRWASEHLYYTVLAGFKSQFAEGYNYPNDSVQTSSFLAPAYLLMSVGMDYKINNVLSLFLSPLTIKTTFLNNQQLADEGAYGLTPAEYDTSGKKISDGKKIRTELGGYFRGQFRKDIFKNINLQSKLELFTNYLHNPQNIDVSWEVLIAMKVNKYITANVSTQLVYDDDIDIGMDSNSDGITDRSGPRTQFKEVLSIGFSVAF